MLSFGQIYAYFNHIFKYIKLQINHVTNTNVTSYVKVYKTSFDTAFSFLTIMI